MKITVEVPEQLGLFCSPEALGKQMLLSHALMLFKEGKISIGLAKELAGLDVYTFMQACAQHGIPVVNDSEADLLDEIRSIRQASVRPLFSEGGEL